MIVQGKHKTKLADKVKYRWFRQQKSTTYINLRTL